LRDAVVVVEAVIRDETICTPRVAATLLRHVATLAADRGLDASTGRPESSLTRRELEVVRLIDRGMSNKQIAVALQIEVATVKNHVHNLLEKLAVQRRGEAAACLRRRSQEPSVPSGV
jgi:two-component system nitrate/nitrite response regulator NarL